MFWRIKSLWCWLSEYITLTPKKHYAPDGWNWHSETGRLCPACESQYQEILNEFLDKLKVSKHRSILEG